MNQDKVAVSVIIPTYNVQEYVGECLQSVLSQSLQNIEVICVDDGSTDGTMKIINSFQAKDKRVKVYSQENLGSGPARNLAMSYATGKYIAFIDGDDFYPSRHVLKRLYNTAVENDVEIVGGYHLNYENGNYISCKYDAVANYFSNHKGEQWVNYRDLQLFWYFYNNLYKRSFLEKHYLTFPDYLRFQVFSAGAIRSLPGQR